MADDPTQSEVDAVVRTLGTHCHLLFHEQAKHIIAALDRVRAEQHKDDCERCKGKGKLWESEYVAGTKCFVGCRDCNGTGKRAPDAKGETNG